MNSYMLGLASVVRNGNRLRRKVGGSGGAGAHDLPQRQSPVVGKVLSFRVIGEEPGCPQRNVLGDDEDIGTQLAASERRVFPENIFQVLFERTTRIAVPETLGQRHLGEDLFSKFEVEVPKVGSLQSEGESPGE